MSLVLVTGGDGKLAQHVIPVLRSEGYRVVAWGRSIDLNNIQLVSDAVARLSEPVTALVHLAGGFEAGFAPGVSHRMYAANVATFVNVLGELEDQRQFADYPSLVVIGHPFDMTDIERSQNFSYYQSKDQLKAIVYGLNNRNQYATVIEPQGAIDTPEKRDDISFRIADAVNSPVAFEQDDYVSDEEVTEEERSNEA